MFDVPEDLKDDTSEEEKWGEGIARILRKWMDDD